MPFLWNFNWDATQYHEMTLNVMSAGCLNMELSLFPSDEMAMIFLNNMKYDGISSPLHYGEVAMGSWTWEFFTFERKIYLEYLDTDKMRG